MKQNHLEIKFPTEKVIFMILVQGCPKTTESNVNTGNLRHLSVLQGSGHVEWVYQLLLESYTGFLQ